MRPSINPVLARELKERMRGLLQGAGVTGGNTR